MVFDKKQTRRMIDGASAILATQPALVRTSVAGSELSHGLPTAQRSCSRSSQFGNTED